ncbi:ABC transporter permease [Gordonia soli]|uniref:Putative ABC transporter permease protein n=1 Tax=Gordonia soli NBRC 108243 TaxID=1223545 RepID=M0QQG8_9ACTN|nr:ABC transporter permease [Gordonia soli]GAC70644.1 putative ABC transporter permease protein [Gordonia soli NBRC 108243]
MTTALAPTAASTRAGAAPRRSVGLLPATATLAQQKVVAAVRSGDAIFALLSPVVFFLCFYVPLHRRFELGGADYAQFLTPIILLQAGIFTAIAATEVAGADARAGIRERMMSLPIPRISPILGRMTWVVGRLLIALVGGLVIGYILGFRFQGSIVDSIGFVILALVFGLALSLLTDAIGSVAASSMAVASFLMIPQLILVLASTGLVPAESFPGWAQPFVRNQPLSVFADALRDLSSGAGLDPTAVIAWSIGLLVAGGLAVAAVGRKQVTR